MKVNYRTILMLFLALLAGGCGISLDDDNPKAQDSLLVAQETPTAAALHSPLALSALDKIDPELLALIEWEESHPGEGREHAPKNFVFDSNGWISCGVSLDPDMIAVVTATKADLQANPQPGGQLITSYGGKAVFARRGDNAIHCYMPLDKIKALVSEQAVIEIVPDISMEFEGPTIIDCYTDTLKQD